VSEPDFETAHLDDLERLPVDDEGLLWRPVRRRFGIEAFGVNAYTAAEPGQRVLEDHREPEGHDELYVVLTGHAVFTLDGEEVDAPAGTLVSVRQGTQRGAHARAAETTVLAIGAKRGEVFTPSMWETWFAGFGYQRAGDEEKGRRAFLDGIERDPESWPARYNYACFESLAGRPEEALEQLRKAAAIDPAETQKAVATDPDFDAMRHLPEFLAIAGEADSTGAST